MCSSTDKANKIKGLKNGKGIKHLLDEAYTIFGNPILLHDMEYKVIALNDHVITDDPIWNEYAAQGTVGSQWLDFFKEECFLDTAANAKLITILTSDKLQYNRFFGKIFNKHNIQIGCACMVACHRPFEENDIALFQDMCAVFSSELGKSKFFNDYGQAYLEKLVGDLIRGIEDRELYTAHVESIYMHLKTNLYLAAVDVRKADASAVQLAHFRDLLRKAQPEYIYAVHADYILIILSTDDSALNVEKDLAKLNKLFRKNRFFAGISSCFDNLFELQKYYKQSLVALEHGRENIDQYIFPYDPPGDAAL